VIKYNTSNTRPQVQQRLDKSCAQTRFDTNNHVFSRITNAGRTRAHGTRRPRRIRGLARALCFLAPRAPYADLPGPPRASMLTGHMGTLFVAGAHTDGDGPLPGWIESYGCGDFLMEDSSAALGPGKVLQLDSWTPQAGIGNVLNTVHYNSQETSFTRDDSIPPARNTVHMYFPFPFIRTTRGASALQIASSPSRARRWLRL
jgi:hypothetical protein